MIGKLFIYIRSRLSMCELSEVLPLESKIHHDLLL
jgi:hypothetical protein